MEKFEKRQNPLLHRDPSLINAMHQNAIQFSKRETGETNRTGQQTKRNRSIRFERIGRTRTRQSTPARKLD
ncbi:hypothetical protein EUGRSUZ_B03421 [Eucalyptus grandis]|uniref:Uncharacterized protein n=2 Tax=Eucalyptus grandis TaxID=71139 RepID=A0ACC3LVX1_EUCGR|nr:hypothetical protein EUGRSUZ_B03421 [Eucalyptus grandis]